MMEEGTQAATVTLLQRERTSTMDFWDRKGPQQEVGLCPDGGA